MPGKHLRGCHLKQRFAALLKPGSRSTTALADASGGGESDAESESAGPALSPSMLRPDDAKDEDEKKETKDPAASVPPNWQVRARAGGRVCGAWVRTPCVFWLFPFVFTTSCRNQLAEMTVTKMVRDVPGLRAMLKGLGTKLGSAGGMGVDTVQVGAACDDRGPWTVSVALWLIRAANGSRVVRCSSRCRCDSISKTSLQR